MKDLYTESTLSSLIQTKWNEHIVDFNSLAAGFFTSLTLHRKFSKFLMEVEDIEQKLLSFSKTWKRRKKNVWRKKVVYFVSLLLFCINLIIQSE